MAEVKGRDIISVADEATMLLNELTLEAQRAATCLLVERQNQTAENEAYTEIQKKYDSKLTLELEISDIEEGEKEEISTFELSQASARAKLRAEFDKLDRALKAETRRVEAKHSPRKIQLRSSIQVIDNQITILNTKITKGNHLSCCGCTH